jgi:hypothetical protein
LLSKENIISFAYPADWHFSDTTPQEGNGQHGKIRESWILSNFKLEEPGRGGIPENAIKVDYEISDGGEKVTIDDKTCDMKAIECTIVQINGHSFKKSVSVLNTGMTALVYETVKKDTFFRASALINTGLAEEENKQKFEQSMQTITVK